MKRTGKAGMVWRGAREGRNEQQERKRRTGKGLKASQRVKFKMFSGCRVILDA